MIGFCNCNFSLLRRFRKRSATRSSSDTNIETERPDHGKVITPRTHEDLSVVEDINTSSNGNLLKQTENQQARSESTAQPNEQATKTQHGFGTEEFGPSLDIPSIAISPEPVSTQIPDPSSEQLDGHDCTGQAFATVHAGENIPDDSHIFELLEQSPGDKEERYIICPEQLPINSEGSTTAPFSSSNELDQPATKKEGTVGDVSADGDRKKGAFRHIYVHFDGNPRSRVQGIMHDTGAGCSLTFEGTLSNLGLDFERLKFDRDLVSITGERFRPIGRRQICFSYYDHPKTKHWIDIVVLSDPADGLKPAFDLLFGRDTIDKVNAMEWNLDVIGAHFVHTYDLTTVFPSLRSPSPRASLLSRTSQDETPKQ